MTIKYIVTFIFCHFVWNENIKGIIYVYTVKRCKSFPPSAILDGRGSSHCRNCRLPLHPGLGRRGSRLSRDTQTSLSPDTTSSSSGASPRRSQATQNTYAPFPLARFGQPVTAPHAFTQLCTALHVVCCISIDLLLLC
ncbi:hypothetical protein ILYODFUR_033914 [Ilyodon furcidens]|uniref:Uncharacterized protein n=1 Tax=Ilyodon furcidens TaxID=33524 RepID=A0ABV0SRE2_9TELE